MMPEVRPSPTETLCNSPVPGVAGGGGIARGLVGVAEVREHGGLAVPIAELGDRRTSETGSV
jgi:hypothetical protein